MIVRLIVTVGETQKHPACGWITGQRSGGNGTDDVVEYDMHRV
jgi:hypothetical protein